MVCSERSCVFPLRIRDSIAFSDRNPSIFARGHSWALIRFFEPRNNARRFRSVAGMRLIIVRKCAVKWVLPRCKFYRDVVASMGRIRVIETAVAFCPLFVLRARAIRNEIISTWQFADPKDRCYDIFFPRIRPRTRRDGRVSDNGLILFNKPFGLSSESRIKPDEESVTKKPR